MAIHLICLVVQRTEPDLHGQITIFSDCPGAPGRVQDLPPYKIPSQCRHSDILKNILVNCSDLMFDWDYVHVLAHQDDHVSFFDLDRPAQLNCMVDAMAKRQIYNTDVAAPVRRQHFPLEPICCFIGMDKMTSDTGASLHFWAHKALARETLSLGKVLTTRQFDLVAWEYVYAALHEVPRLFQLWACKQVLGVAGTNGLHSRWTDGLSPRCPSCKCCMETCSHVVLCNEIGRVETLQMTIGLLQEWLVEVGTDPDLGHCLIEYAAARNSKTMEEIC